MKKLILGLMFVLLLGCDPEWVVKGDSMAYNLAVYWQNTTSEYIENDGHPGYAVEQLPIDHRMLHRVVIFAGVNDFNGFHETVEKTELEYATYFMSLKAKEVVCVGVPKITINTSILPQIQELNGFIKDLCGASHYIDTWAMPFTSHDGLHPDDKMNRKIKKAIEKEIS
jgi:hypothetical protein